MEHYHSQGVWFGLVSPKRCFCCWRCLRAPLLAFGTVSESPLCPTSRHQAPLTEFAAFLELAESNLVHLFDSLSLVSQE